MFFFNFKTGEELFRKLLMDEEKLNIDMVYEVIDWHTKAVLKTREITEVEMEAIALSRIGKVYDKVLKLKYKAKEYLLRAMQLANSMHPRNFHGEGILSSLHFIKIYEKNILKIQYNNLKKLLNVRNPYTKKICRKVTNSVQ